MAALKAVRQEFEGAHEIVVRLSHPATGTINLAELARAWRASEKIYRDYAEACRAFFRVAQGKR